MGSIANPVSQGNSTAGSVTGTGISPKLDPLANESTFLQLLVSQLQNQDPLNPTDSTTFVSQLTSYSQLEQLIKIDSNTTPASTSAGSSTSTQSSSTQGA